MRVWTFAAGAFMDVLMPLTVTFCARAVNTPSFRWLPWRLKVVWSFDFGRKIAKVLDSLGPGALLWPWYELTRCYSLLCDGMVAIGNGLGSVTVTQTDVWRQILVGR